MLLSSTRVGEPFSLFLRSTDRDTTNNFLASTRVGDPFQKAFLQSNIISDVLSAIENALRQHTQLLVRLVSLTYLLSLLGYPTEIVARTARSI